MTLIIYITPFCCLSGSRTEFQSEIAALTLKQNKCFASGAFINSFVLLIAKQIDQFSAPKGPFPPIGADF